MQKEPACGLCGGRLVRESNVAVNCGLPMSFDLAWVCSQCAAAYPIAVVRRSLFGPRESLYENGKRIEDK
jgi:predicted amidophosphoribosyltransferase